MTLVQDEPLLFFSRLQALYEKVAAQDPLTRIRAKAWDRLQELGFPTKKHPDFRPIRLRPIFTHPLSLPKESAPSRDILRPFMDSKSITRLVFLNGTLAPQLSSLDFLPKKVVLQTLHEAMGHYASLLNETFLSRFTLEDNPFALINTACQKGGLFLYIPPKQIFEEPLQIVHLITEVADHTLLLPKLSLFVGSESEVKIEFETIYQGGQGAFVNGLFDIELGEGAHLHLTETLANTPKGAIHFHHNRASLKAKSHLKSVYLTNGASLCRNDFHLLFQGEGAEADLSGLWVLGEKKECHHHILVEHVAPRCRSMQLFKGVLHDESYSSFDGKIVIRKEAMKTEAYQLNHNLLLSPRARAKTKPNLKIFADDVKASHGATVGQLQEDQLFYLLTRGIPRKKAEEILIHGFCQQVVQLLPYDSLKKIIEEWE